MTELEKKSGTITNDEEPSPRHNKSVDPKSIKRGSVEPS